MGAFDFAIPEAHVPQRFLTTVPQQALYLMNSPFILEESKHLIARSEIQSASGDRDRVDRVYRTVFGRAAKNEEVQAALDYIHSDTEKQEPTPATVWQYGLASIDQFEPLKYFVNEKWQPASITPQPLFGDAELSAKGGMPTDDPSKAITRRWISPVTGTVEITGALTHEVNNKPEEYHKEWGDGVRARIVLNGSKKLVEEIVYNRKAELAVKELAVAPGDTIDFMVDCRTDSENDGFQWTPVVTAGSRVWDANKDFAGPAPLSLSAWEKLAQVLLQTSEFAFVD
jgi:hypothetical protein